MTFKPINIDSVVMYWLAITIVVVGVVCTSADKVSWKYCKSQDIWDMKKLSSEDGQLTLVGTPSMDISGGSQPDETPFFCDVHGGLPCSHMVDCLKMAS